MQQSGISTTESEPTDESDSRQVRTSVVLPAYNEQHNIEPLVEEILVVFNEHPEYGPVEIIIVDDGSTDETRDVIRDIAVAYDEVLGVFLSRNFGQSPALNAGIERATGEYIVTMDADGQNDPADVPQLLEELDNGVGCVSGWRRDRNDPFAKTVPSAIQTVMARWTGPDIHDFGCTLKAYQAEALNQMPLYGEGHRYIPAKLYKRGYQITETPVNHRPRTEGRTKYGYKRLPRGFVDLLFHIFWNRYSTRPVHFLGGGGLISFTLGSLIGFHVLYLKYILGQSLAPHLPRLVLVVALVLFGIILLMFGFLAEMLTMIYYQDKKPYRIQSVVTSQDEDHS